MPSVVDTKMEDTVGPPKMEDTVMGLAVDHSRTTQEQNAVHDTFLNPNKQK